MSLLCPVTLPHLSRTPESNWVEENIGQLSEKRAEGAQVCFVTCFLTERPYYRRRDVGRRKSEVWGLMSVFPQLGPENTMMSFEKAVENGVFGLETDVYLR